jgi:hypothetical protein
VFAGRARAKGDLAGVFKYDDSDNDASATAYFYLYDVETDDGEGTLDSIHIRSGPWNIREEGVEVRRDKNERMVGLFIFGTPWAAFDSVASEKFGRGSTRHRVGCYGAYTQIRSATRC